jgi:molybdopterin converting factor subunit 1
MHVTLKFFAILRERLGASSLELELPEGDTVAAAIEKIAAINPQIASMLNRSAFAVSRAYSGRDTILQDKDELAIIPPVSGG